jgi:hypothetical protein
MTYCLGKGSNENRNYFLTSSFRNEPECMDHTGYHAQQGKKNINPEMETDSHLKKRCNRRQKYGYYYFEKRHA